jgi:hypothetical protein
MSQSRRDEPPDHYETLEVSPRASHEVIQAAYRVLARNAHPDRNPDSAAEQRIRRINAAYAIIGDPAHRARYDVECTRARRSARLSFGRADGVERVSARAEPARVLVTRRPLRTTREERAHVVSPQALILMCAVVCLSLAMAVMLWISIDAALSDERLPLDALPSHTRVAVDPYPYGTEGR